ncbi:hypothetical protein BOTBODRAFT_470475 [Botryobasidium botryosum FD-172 SS1]|uniref:Uncharacterized protein n=1 Tax=Botryobasidium botryosum (strain FD-172 SS1) TaxID=930990 RepID=A0A067M645_BOTB1|nr:hypothetical protein BOTBODRAFT_470475 [Botryobasidium botryosum FD-172 SS1]
MSLMISRLDPLVASTTHSEQKSPECAWCASDWLVEVWTTAGRRAKVGPRKGGVATGKGSSKGNGRGSSSSGAGKGVGEGKRIGGPPIALAGGHAASAYSPGGGKPFTIPPGKPFAGRVMGGGSRSNIYTSFYGYDRVGAPTGPWVAGRPFPYGFWPLYWGGPGPGFYGCSEVNHHPPLA